MSCVSIKFVSLLCIIFFITFPGRGSMDIGLWLDTLVLSPPLYKGLTLATFKELGIVAVVKILRPVDRIRQHMSLLIIL